MEDYKKKYENALNAARKFKNDCPSLWDTKSNPFKGVFEELEESEDERMIKSLKRLIKAYYDVNFPTPEGFEREDMIAWLEKQGEQKTVSKTEPIVEGLTTEFQKQVSHLIASAMNKEHEYTKGYVEWVAQSLLGYAKNERTSIDEIKPKFKVGDWVVSPNGVHWHIDSINNNRYEVSSTNGACADWPLDTDLYHLWTIQDAKDGDVLTTKNFIFIFKNIDNDNGVRYYCHYEISNNEEDNLFEVSFPQCVMGRVGNGLSYYSPATEEQCNLLFSKMKEAGYKWDAEKKELKKIEQKPAWSEEDEERLSDAVFFVREYQIPTRDKRLLNTAKEAEKWLKSLKERYTWKPSDEQIDGIECAIKTLQHQLNVGDKRLDSLYNDLKKLKG